MTVDYIRYDILTQDAMRSVVRTVLADAAAKGLPGEHHFFISFDTRADGASLSPRLKAQYPKEMTIVLQHQFWDLIVGEDRFEVGLSFGGSAERLVVPFRAITGFADPSVQFGLQFSATGDEEEAGEEPAAEKKSGHRPPARHERPPGPAQALPTPANPGPDAKPPAKADEAPASGGEVVRLDRFRKK
ncbi:MAG TPA: ClpXP protease specificity-enhancing factor SspB [Xanthobacteraceae bacterium]|jgi:uncharacterized protein